MMGQAAPAPVDVANVFALIALITDPEAAKQRLADIQTASDGVLDLKREADKRIEEAQARMAEVAQANSILENRESENLREIERALKEREDLDRRKVAIEELAARNLQDQNARAAELTTREQEMLSQQAAFSLALEQQEAALVAREAQVANDEAKAAETQRKAEQLRDEYRTKMDKLNAAISA